MKKVNTAQEVLQDILRTKPTYTPKPSEKVEFYCPSGHKVRAPKEYECGWINQNLKLKDRTWTCGGCGVEHDRDSNASRMILQQGLKEINTVGNTGIKACGLTNKTERTINRVRMIHEALTL